MDSDEEDFVSIGTPLPEYSEDEVPQKPTPYQEQSVKDERGRPLRFHGAFAGGFSAGYFNTVGTKEGFKPATFVSRKSKRAELSQTQPEDYMDDEDLTEHGIAPRVVTTTHIFTSAKESRKRLAAQRESGIIPDAEILQNIILPASESMGVQLLRKLGWKDGQGVGPKTQKKSKKKPRGGKKIYGCSLPQSATSCEESEESSEDEFSHGFTFAPKDVNPINFEAKDNVHGLGYRGLDPSLALHTAHINLFEPTSLTQISDGKFGQPQKPTKRNQKGITGHAFGVGSLNEEDEDIYGLDKLSNYDHELGGTEVDSLHGWTAPKMRKSRWSDNEVSKVKVLEGFVLSSQPLSTKKVFLPPKIPRDFRPFHKWTELPKYRSGVADKSKVHFSQMSASTRAEVLGEVPQVKSVFDLIPKKDQEHMKTFKPGSASEIQAANSPAGPVATTSSSLTEVTLAEEKKATVPLFSGNMGGLNAFKPFVADPEKQKRYEVFLERTKEGKKYLQKEEKSSQFMTEWEQEKEREEFARAAHLYRPLSALMASRFTRATHSDEISAVEVAEPMEAIPVTDQEKAADMKMYGKLTREIYEWHPDKLLCRRFNVPNPYPDSTIVGVPKIKKEKFSLYNFLHVPEPTPESVKESEPKALPAPPKKQSKPTSAPMEVSISSDIPSIKLEPGTDQADVTLSSNNVEPENQNEPEAAEVEEVERPPMDLFKAIFANSDSSSSSESEDDEIQPITSINTSIKDTTSVTKSIESLSEDASSIPQAQGNILSKEQKPLTPVCDASDSNSDVIIEEERTMLPRDEDKSHDSPRTISTPEVYGPAPPPDLEVGVASVSQSSSRDILENKHRKHKHKHKSKEKHKHKKKKDKKNKHKKKQKHKKKSSKHKKEEISSESSTSDSENESADDNEPSTLQLLQRLQSLNRRSTAMDYM